MPNYTTHRTTTVRLRDLRDAAKAFRDGWFQNPCRDEGDVSLVNVLYFCQTVANEMMSESSTDIMEAFVAAVAAEDFESARDAVTMAAQKAGGECAAFFEPRDPGWTWRFEFFVDCWPEP